MQAAFKCFTDQDCRRALRCLSGCDLIEDDTPDKIVLQVGGECVYTTHT